MKGLMYFVAAAGLSLALILLFEEPVHTAPQKRMVRDEEPIPGWNVVGWWTDEFGVAHPEYRFGSVEFRRSEIDSIIAGLSDTTTTVK